jgi:hypothetical protein
MDFIEFCRDVHFYHLKRYYSALADISTSVCLTFITKVRKKISKQ